MSDLTRAFAGDLEIRADRSGRTIAGIVVPFNTPARVSDGGPAYLEAFQRGSFAKTIAERGDRVKLLYQHNSLEPIGRATLLREDSAGLYGEFHVSSLNRGDEALELVNDGVIDSFSVGFAPIKHEKRDGMTVRTEVRMREASLVTFPAYEDARIQAVRAAFGDMSAPELIALLRNLDLPEISASTPDGEPDAAQIEPVPSATRDIHRQFMSLRLLARERGVL